jgi:hypothetical protein
VIRLNQESEAIEMSNNLIRWSGLAYLLAGLSLIAQQIYELVGPDPTSPGWVAIHTLGYLGLALGLIGLVGIYLAQRNEVGRLGTIGFVLGFLGNALTIGAAFLNTFLVPVLTNAAPDLLSPAGPLFTGPMGMIILLSAVMVTLGRFAGHHQRLVWTGGRLFAGCICDRRYSIRFGECLAGLRGLVKCGPPSYAATA